jgi:hypothetical protein
MENQASVCTALIAAKATGLRFTSTRLSLPRTWGAKAGAPSGRTCYAMAWLWSMC